MKDVPLITKWLEKILKTDYFDPHKSFLKLPSFWLTVIISLSTSISIATVITLNSDLHKNFTYEGFNHAITVFKIPLGILAITIPIIALLAANHRSEQTRAQMRIASENNNFTNYYKHCSEFESYIEKHHKTTFLEITNTRAVHKKIFPQAKKGIFSIKENPELIFDNMIREILQELLFMCEEDPTYTDNKKRLKIDHDKTISRINSARNTRLKLQETLDSPGKINPTEEARKRRSNIENRAYRIDKAILNLINREHHISNETNINENDRIQKEGISVRRLNIKISNFAREFEIRVVDANTAENITATTTTPDANTKVTKKCLDIINSINLFFRFDENYTPPKSVEVFQDVFGSLEDPNTPLFNKIIIYNRQKRLLNTD